MKDMSKHSMAKGKDEILKNRAGTDDVRKFLKGVVKANKAKGIRVGFKWRKMIGVIDRVAGSFNVQSLRTRVLSREDSYVFLGRAKRNNEVHAKMMKSPYKTCTNIYHTPCHIFNREILTSTSKPIIIQHALTFINNHFTRCFLAPAYQLCNH